jgi:homocitrate synthase
MNNNWLVNFQNSHSRLENFSIIESTLREGEQFANAFFTLDQKKTIAKMLSDFGVEYIELTSPAASEEVKLFLTLFSFTGNRTHSIHSIINLV